VNFRDVAFTVIFGLEMLLKIVAFSFVTYISNGLNQLDAFIVVLSVVLQMLDALNLNTSALGVSG
jgi:hypothetical protein